MRRAWTEVPASVNIEWSRRFLGKLTNSKDFFSNSLFMCQDEDENEDENQSFGSFWKVCMTNAPIL